MRAISGTAIAAVALAGLAATGAGAQSGTDPGVSAKAVKIGYIFSETGAAGSTFKNAGKACKARIDRAERRRRRQRAQDRGRVHRRPVVGRESHRQPGPRAEPQRVHGREQLVVRVPDCRYMLGQGVPMIGGGFDGTYYGQKGNETMLSGLGNGAPFNGLGLRQRHQGDEAARRHEERRGRLWRVAVLDRVGEGDRRTSPRPRRGSRASTRTPPSTSAAPTSAPSSSASRTRAPTGCTSRWWRRHDFAILQGLQQNGVKMKAILMPTGYSQDLLDSPTAVDQGPNNVLFQTYKPVEIGDKATKQFQADLKKVRAHRGARLRDLHGVHHVRPGGDRARAGGQDADPEGLRRRLPWPRHLGPGGSRLPARRRSASTRTASTRPRAASTP